MEDDKTKNEKKFTPQQKIYLYFYKSRQYIQNDWINTKTRLIRFVDSPLFYAFIFSVFLIIFQGCLIKFEIVISEDTLKNLGFAIAGIIGASIAIVFSFSTFILQSTADLFSTQYLNKFIQDKKEKLFFWILVFLTVFSFIVPIFITQSVPEILITILFIAFYLIYSLYKELRTRINPETTLTKIGKDAIKRLNQAHRELKKHANIQNKIFKYEGQSKDISLAVQYKSVPNWNHFILEDVKYLYEIGLRLLSKNEISSFNLTIKYIHDIYLHHLSLRSGHIMRIPASFWGAYTFEDEGFTNKVLEYLESISNRIIQEKRKENIYYLLNIYENLIANLSSFEYADKSMTTRGENPILSLVMAYYLGLIEKLTQTKENDWVWESIKSVSRVSNFLLSKDYNYFNYEQINTAINKIVTACLGIKQEAFLKEVVKIYFDQIKIAWEKYPKNQIFWDNLFKELKKNTLYLSILSGMNLSLSELYIDFHSWQVNVVNAIFDLKDTEKQKEYTESYVDFLGRWSDFLLDFARDTGLENKQVGLPIVQSVENNLRIIYGLKNKFNLDLEKIYRTQFNTLSWYFQKTEKVEESFLFNLEQIQETLLREIDSNLTDKIFDTKQIIDLYIRLVDQHFEKVSVGYGYNHPRVIEKLICLGLIMTKHNLDTSEIIKLIDELNKKYLVLNKEYFDLKAKEPNLMGPDEYQLCKEIHDLENDLFSYNSGMRMGIKAFLSSEINKDIWDRFIGLIKYCEGIEYQTRHIF